MKIPVAVVLAILVLGYLTHTLGYMLVIVVAGYILYAIVHAIVDQKDWKA